MAVGTRLTPHQRWTLLSLRRTQIENGARLHNVEADQDLTWVLGKRTGAPAACEILVREGYAERFVMRGPRGGKVYYYRPTSDGIRMAHHIVANRLKTY